MRGRKISEESRVVSVLYDNDVFVCYEGLNTCGHKISASDYKALVAHTCQMR